MKNGRVPSVLSGHRVCRRGEGARRPGYQKQETQDNRFRVAWWAASGVWGDQGATGTRSCAVFAAYKQGELINSPRVEESKAHLPALTANAWLPPLPLPLLFYPYPLPSLPPHTTLEWETLRAFE